MSTKHLEGSFQDSTEERLTTLENSGFTANETDAHLKNRANHTGTQLSSTISDFQTAVDARVNTIVGAAPAALDTLEEIADALDNDPNFAASMTTLLAGKASTTDLSTLAARVTALENWKDLMPKRSKRFTGTTDANGDVTIDLTSGGFTSAPSIGVTYIFNNNNYGTHYNIKTLSATSVQLRVMRNKETSVLLGGSIDPDEPLVSTAIVLRATEY